MTDRKEPDWFCPKCGSVDTRRDKACRICNDCGHRASMEAFCPPISAAADPERWHA